MEGTPGYKGTTGPIKRILDYRGDTGLWRRHQAIKGPPAYKEDTGL